MNEKVKNILKTTGIWLGIISLVSIIYNCFDYNSMKTAKDFFIEVGKGILIPFELICDVLPIFIPTIIILYFLFKKFKDRKIRIFLVSFLIPFTNMIYFYIDSIRTVDAFSSQVVGFFAVFYILPMIIILTAVTPKSLLPIKYDILKTCGLMFVFGWILIFLSWIMVSFFDDIYSYLTLKKYDKVIKKLEIYKDKNGIYPDKLQNIVRMKNLSYINYDEGQNIILIVDKDSPRSYKYCSDKNIDECKEGWYDYRLQKRIGKWVKSVEDDD